MALLSIRRLILFACIFLALMAADGARAQETDTTLLTQAAQQTAAASSYRFNLTLHLDLSGIPGGGIVLDLNGSGTVTRGDSGAALDLTLNGTGRIGNRPAPTSVKARIVDGIFYFNLSGSDRWSGAHVNELAPLVEDLIVSNFVQGFTSTADVPLIAGQRPSGSTDDPSVRAALQRVSVALGQIDVNRFAAIQRLPDETVDNAVTAHFASQIALADLARSDEAVNLLVNLVRVGNPAQPDLSDSEGAAVGALFAQLFSQATLTLDHYVGLDDGYFHRWSAHGSLLFDPSTLNRQGNAVHLGFDFDARLSDFNQDAPIGQPPNAFVISGLASALGLKPPDKSGTGTQSTAPASPALAGQSIAANTPAIVAVASGAPADMIFNGHAGQTISVIARSLEQSGSLDPEVTVLDSSNLQLAQNDDNTGGRPNLQPFDSVIENLTLPVTGPYLIRVNTLSADANGRVELTIETTFVPTATLAPTLTHTPTATFAPTSTPLPTLTSTPTVTPTLTPTATPTLAPTATPVPPQIITLSDRIPEQGSYPYPFAASAGQIVTVTVHATGELDPRVKLVGPDGAIIAENDDHEDLDSALNSYDSRLIDVTLPQSGAYQLEITGFAGTGGPFDLTLVIATPGQVAPVVTEAAALPAHQEFAVSIGLGQSVDTPLALQAGDVYTLSAAATGGDLDALIEVLDPGGNIVVASDNHGSSDPTLAATDARIDNWIVPVSETYTVRVSGARMTTGDALLIVERSAGGAPIGTGTDQVVTGEVQPNNLFTLPIEAQAGDYLTITARTLSAGLDPHVALLDAAGTVLAENDDHSALDPALSDVDARVNNVRVPSSGTYMVQVSGYNGSSGPFALTITIVRPA